MIPTMHLRVVKKSLFEDEKEFSKVLQQFWQSGKIVNLDLHGGRGISPELGEWRDVPLVKLDGG